jgi:hypothetical protein
MKTHEEIAGTPGTSRKYRGKMLRFPVNCRPLLDMDGPGKQLIDIDTER